MKAIVNTEYGPPGVLELREVEKPAPGDREVLIKVHATTVTAADYRLRGSSFPAVFWLPGRLIYGLRRPKRTILGTELAGVVEAAGKEVTSLKKGDLVFGMDGSRFGAYAQYVCRSENSALAQKPPGLDFEEAASIPFGALTALYFLRDRGKIRRDQKVLIYGASGGVGTAAVQLAVSFGAVVTGVCSTSNLEMVRSLGADRVIDYTREDFTSIGETWDIIFDTVGKTSFSRCRSSLAREGRHLFTVFGLKELLQMLWTSVIGGKKVICDVAPEKKEDLLFIRGLVEEGKIRPVIDKRYPLEQAAKAHEYAEKGHKRGSVVITIGLESGRPWELYEAGACILK